MRARIGTALCAGLAVAALVTGCSVSNDKNVEQVIDEKGELALGTIERIQWDNTEAPSRVYFSLEGDGKTTFNCEVVRVNGCALLEQGDRVTVTYIPDKYVINVGPVDTVLDVQRTIIPATITVTPAIPTQPTPPS